MNWAMGKGKTQGLPGLFDTGIACSRCMKPIERQAGSGHILAGFWDADLKMHVCNGCKGRHYDLKRETEFAGMYSEVPVNVNHHLFMEGFNKKR